MSKTLTSDRITELYRESRYPSVGWAHRFARAIEREVLATQQPEPRDEVTDAQVTARAVLDELRGRGGFDHLIDGLDEETHYEMTLAIATIIGSARAGDASNRITTTSPTNRDTSR
ncbi:hypothetical protein ACVBR5_000869 [Burkholderia cenocepacia]